MATHRRAIPPAHDDRESSGLGELSSPPFRAIKTVHIQ